MNIRPKYVSVNLSLYRDGLMKCQTSVYNNLIPKKQSFMSQPLILNISFSINSPDHECRPLKQIHPTFLGKC